MRVARSYRDILLNLGLILPTELGCIISLNNEGHPSKDKGQLVGVATEQPPRLSIVEGRAGFLM